MPVAIILESTINNISNRDLKAEVVKTPYGGALLFFGQIANTELIVIAREGVFKEIPAHKINYRANIKALHQKGVKRIFSIYEVGSINLDIVPKSVSALGDLLDFTKGRESTFFDDEENRVRHVDMSTPFCPNMTQKLIDSGPEFNFVVRSNTVYVTTQGTRLSTPAEINMYRRMGGEVVGMSAMPEISLARELGMCVAGAALSVNWAAGVQREVQLVEEGLKEIHVRLFDLALHTLCSTQDQDCRAATLH